MRKKLKPEKGMTGDEFRDIIDKEIDELAEVKKRLLKLEERVSLLEGYIGLIKGKEIGNFETDSTEMSLM